MRAALVTLLFVSASAFAQEVALREIVTGLASPVALAHAGDARLFIVLQGGRLVIHDRTQLLATPFLDIRHLVHQGGGERGLLGLAFHPDYAENGFFYVYYTDLLGDLVIARFEVTEDPNVADAGSIEVLLTIPHQTYSNHNGGQLAFGPDGYLYAGPGDGGSGGDPFNSGQRLDTLLGKILRLDVDADPPYIPPSNPFVGTENARPEIWAYGLRNPWRFSFDRENGDLFIADVGQGSWEEVNHQPGASTGGENYGWRIMEGSACYPPGSTCEATGLTMPVIVYGHSSGNCSVTGGYRYRGSMFTRLRGLYIYGDYCSGRIWGAGANWQPVLLLDTPLFISSFGEDWAGELYVLHHGGTLYQIEDADAPASAPASVTAGATTATNVRVTWSAVSGATGYRVERNDGVVFDVGASPFDDSSVAADTAYRYAVRATNSAGLGPASAPDLATTVIFSDDPLLPQMTLIRAEHVLQLRTAVNAVRALAGLAPAAFTDSTLTIVRAVHVQELRARLDEARPLAGLPPASYTDATLTPGSTVVRAAHAGELRSAVR